MNTLIIESKIPNNLNEMSIIKVKFKENKHLSKYFDYNLLKHMLYAELNGVEINKSKLSKLLYA